jgi:hypothetical protein
MAALQGPFPILKLPEGLLDRVAGCLELWDLAAARSACRAMRAAAGRRARRLCFSPISMLCEHGSDGYVQVGHDLATGCWLRAAHSQAVHSPPPTQKRRPTSFQLFPNAREVVLQPWDSVYPKKGESVELHLQVLGVFRLPGAPADAAAARAALAGVTRLEMAKGVLDPTGLAAALLHLPRLRAVSLLCADCSECGSDAVGADLVAALAGCPRLESLEWDLQGRSATGAPGHAVPLVE